MCQKLRKSYHLRAVQVIQKKSEKSFEIPEKVAFSGIFGRPRGVYMRMKAPGVICRSPLDRNSFLKCFKKMPKVCRHLFTSYVVKMSKFRKISPKFETLGSKREHEKLFFSKTLLHTLVLHQNATFAHYTFLNFEKSGFLVHPRDPSPPTPINFWELWVVNVV